MTDCLFSGQGLEVPPRQTATGTFHADQRDVFSGVGESLRGGGDSFYKKRPRPLSSRASGLCDKKHPKQKKPLRFLARA